MEVILCYLCNFRQCLKFDVKALYFHDSQDEIVFWLLFVLFLGHNVRDDSTNVNVKSLRINPAKVRHFSFIQVTRYV